MDERAGLALAAAKLEAAGDDAAVIDGQVITTDMLHETTDFPAGTSRYTAGWRAVGASLSDVAAMGANATAAVAAYGAPSFDREELEAFLRGAREVCGLVGAEYVGGDLDTHQEFTVATTALGRTDDPVLRSGAQVGDAVCVTGSLGRSAAALTLFERGEHERANELFQFEPRVAAGRALAPYATAMMDSSDGLARSLHQLAAASECGFALESAAVPVADSLSAVTETKAQALEQATTFGEDFELVCTIRPAHLEAAHAETDVSLSVIGTVVESGITMDGEPMEDRGFTHG